MKDNDIEKILNTIDERMTNNYKTIDGDNRSLVIKNRKTEKTYVIKVMKYKETL